MLHLQSLPSQWLVLVVTIGLAVALPNAPFASKEVEDTILESESIAAPYSQSDSSAQPDYTSDKILVRPRLIYARTRPKEGKETRYAVTTTDYPPRRTRNRSPSSTTDSSIGHIDATDGEDNDWPNPTSTVHPMEVISTAASEKRPGRYDEYGKVGLGLPGYGPPESTYNQREHDTESVTESWPRRKHYDDDERKSVRSTRKPLRSRHERIKKTRPGPGSGHRDDSDEFGREMDKENFEISSGGKKDQYVPHYPGSGLDRDKLYRDGGLIYMKDFHRGGLSAKAR